MTDIKGLKQTKVFGIGFHKTGTSTLTEVLRHLGYRVTGPNWTTEADIASTYLERCRERSKEFDGFQDNPWPLVYREMDAMWPGSKFILTTRNVDKWIASQVKHFGKRETPMRHMIYGNNHGCPAGNEQRYAQVFDSHIAAARSYFKGRDEDFLEIDLTVDSSWAPICGFLGVEEPSIPFPHANSASQRMNDGSLLRRVLRRLLR